MADKLLTLNLCILAETVQTNPEALYLNRTTGETALGVRPTQGSWLRIPIPPSRRVYEWMGLWLDGAHAAFSKNSTETDVIAKLVQRHQSGGDGVFSDLKRMLEGSPNLKAAWIQYRKNCCVEWIRAILKENQIKYSLTGDTSPS